MPLTNTRYKKLTEAIASAFPTKDDLRKLSRFELDVDLDRVAGGDTYDVIVFNFIGWADAVGKIELLLQKGIQYNPDNALLREIADELLPDVAHSSLSSNRVNRVPAIRLELEEWADRVRRCQQLPDRLLREEPFLESEREFKDLDSFLASALDRGITVEVYSSTRSASQSIRTSNEFWVIVLIALTAGLPDTPLGPLRWLIENTIRALKAESSPFPPRLNHIWKGVLRADSTRVMITKFSSSPELVYETLFEVAGQDYDAIYRFVMFARNLIGADYEQLQVVADSLEAYDERLGDNARPRFLETLKRLYGNIRADLVNTGNFPPFNPKLTLIPGTSLCNYPFQSMVHTLTIADYVFIRKVLPKNIREGERGNLLLPYVFEIVSASGMLYNLLTSEVFSIVKLCRDFEADPRYEWDIPTASEWLSLAGCETNPYPWGDEAPTELRANLDFGRPSRLRPVGAYPLGRSPYGAQDCCGNVHEIVRIASDDDFSSLRLMGGCYQTNSHNSSCQIIRRLRARPHDERRNVGIRLVRYEKRLRGRRMESLSVYNRENTQGEN